MSECMSRALKWWDRWVETSRSCGDGLTGERFGVVGRAGGGGFGEDWFGEHERAEALRRSFLVEGDEVMGQPFSLRDSWRASFMSAEMWASVLVSVIMGSRGEVVPSKVMIWSLSSISSLSSSP